MNLLIIQARMGSKRLPGKVMRQINDMPILKILIERISKTICVNELIVATTLKNEDNEINSFCLENKIDIYRGSDWDVLDRFYKAAIYFKNKPKNIIRVCSDNPLLHSEIIDNVYNNYIKSGKDYFSNSNNEPFFLEDGFDVEIFSFKALESAWKNSILASEREHVCPYIKKNFKCGWKKVNKDYNFKLSVDSIDDFKLVELIFDELSHIENFTIDDVVKLLVEKPHFLEINKNSRINSGYLESLKNDKEIG